MQSDFAHNQPLAGGLIGLLLALRYNRRLALFRKLTRLGRDYFRVPQTRNPFQQCSLPTLPPGVAAANQNQYTQHGQAACRRPSSIPFAQSLPHQWQCVSRKPHAKMHKTNTLFQRMKRQISWGIGVPQIAPCILSQIRRFHVSVNYPTVSPTPHETLALAPPRSSCTPPDPQTDSPRQPSSWQTSPPSRSSFRAPPEPHPKPTTSPSEPSAHNPPLA